MRRALAALAAAVIGSASYVSAATIVDETYTITRDGGWGVVGTPITGTADAKSGSNYVTMSLPGTTDDWGLLLVSMAMDSSILAGDVDPTANPVSLSFWYRSNIGMNFKVGLSSGAWNPAPASGIFSNGSGGTTMNGVVLGNVAWLDAAPQWTQVTVNITQWEQSVAPSTPLTDLLVIGGWTTGGARVDLDSASIAVPEPTSLGLLATGSLIALRRRRA